MKITRKSFLKVAGLGLVSTTGVVTGLGELTKAFAESKGKHACLVEPGLCAGCLSCAIACKKTNENSGTYDYSPDLGSNVFTTVKFKNLGTEEEPNWLKTKVQCFHCAEASCIDACAAGAIKREGDIVKIDKDICIGCKNCHYACPFGVPRFDPESGVMKKCNFCSHRVSKGLPPACAEACPTDAIFYGTKEEVLKRAEERMAIVGGKARIYGKDVLGGTAWLYLLEDEPEVYGFPNEPKRSSASMPAKWLTALLAAGGLTIVPYWLVAKEAKEKGGGK
ncbi:4Fe-4S dicluster domain-containing protein [Candidatus Oleimmundimicrobium sp.]|uniref:4Fe-4S dicluster domain-containing protein n=1 Tax=Candidatus Oleimmundimicrobium sp. TaxID=3060597 RepID=UPI0027168502|nr:4Fe-4S dicluster domain-containing protein [Candidatus Oleimmundimicrobium sp.]MDO8886324.1 4Fe-4S binding protein [Candidatus Oleimmundimicrobium sp.]